jgi:DNA-binding transcriptional ArsR family regulator
MITELAQPFAMSLPAASKHLRVLESAGLVDRRVQGRIHHCSLQATALGEIEAWLAFYRPYWAGTLESLAHFVEGDQS